MQYSTAMAEITQAAGLSLSKPMLNPAVSRMSQWRH